MIQKTTHTHKPLIADPLDIMNSVAVLDIVILLLLATLYTGHLTQVNLIAPGSDTHCWLVLATLRPHKPHLVYMVITK